MADGSNERTEDQGGVVVALPLRTDGSALWEPWLDERAIARHYGVSTRTVRRWRAAGMPSRSLRRSTALPPVGVRGLARAAGTGVSVRLKNGRPIIEVYDPRIASKRYVTQPRSARSASASRRACGRHARSSVRCWPRRSARPMGATRRSGRSRSVGRTTSGAARPGGCARIPRSSTTASGSAGSDAIMASVPCALSRERKPAAGRTRTHRPCRRCGRCSVTPSRTASPTRTRSRD